MQKKYKRIRRKVKQWNWYDTLMAILLFGSGLFIYFSGTQEEFIKMLASGIFMSLFIGLIFSQIIKRNRK